MQWGLLGFQGLRPGGTCEAGVCGCGCGCCDCWLWGLVVAMSWDSPLKVKAAGEMKEFVKTENLFNENFTN